MERVVRHERESARNEESKTSPIIATPLIPHYGARVDERVNDGGESEGSERAREYGEWRETRGGRGDVGIEIQCQCRRQGGEKRTGAVRRKYCRLPPPVRILRKVRLLFCIFFFFCTMKIS